MKVPGLETLALHPILMAEFLKTDPEPPQPPTQTPPAPVEEPPDKPETEPGSPVQEPEPREPKRWAQVSNFAHREKFRQPIIALLKRVALPRRFSAHLNFHSLQ